MSSTPQPNHAPGPREWRLLPPMPSAVRTALAGAGLTPLLAQLLYNRGNSTADQARAFLSTTPLLHDPALLPGMAQAVQRLRAAVQRGERVAVFGDFDTDGVTATAILARALHSLGLDIFPYIPHRIEEGHGLSTQAVRMLAERGVDLLVTVDCGVTSYAEVELAQDLGIDVLVTDHHLAPQGPPQATAVIDPRLPGSRYPFPYLTGAGLALKLSQALCEALPPEGPGWEAPLFALAALGTVSDVAPLVDENRFIVQRGLAELARASAPGLRALLRSAGIRSRPLDSEDIAWALAPRLNAAGRIDHAGTSYRLLVTDSEKEAELLASTLEQQNRQRQLLTQDAFHKALATAAPAPLLFIEDPSFPPGIIGLVASRLTEQFYRPAVVVSVGPEISRGSCRSIPDFDIGSALHRVAPGIQEMVRYGGHPRAAGFTIATGGLPALREALVRLAREAMGDPGPQPKLDIDLEIPLRALPRDIYKTAQKLAPFGEGNPVPVFLSRGVRLVERRAVGSNGDHLLLKVQDGPVTWNAVAFSQGKSAAGAPDAARHMDMVYSITVDRWGSLETLRLDVKDFRPA